MEKDWCLPLTGFDHFADIEGSRAIATADSKGDNLSPINNNIVAFQNVSSNRSPGGSLKCVQFTNSFADIEGSHAIATADSKGEQHQSSFFSESSLHTNFSASQSVKQ